MAQWLRLQVPHAGNWGSIPGQGTRFLQGTCCSLKTSYAATKAPTCYNEDQRFHVLQLRPAAK